MICPNGHTSVAEDFCDTCGAKIDLAAQPASPSPSGASTGSPAAAPTDQTCPHCQTVNPLDALFCEACGYDFTTGALPRGAEPAASPPAGSPESGSLDLDAPSPEGAEAAGAPVTAVPVTAVPVAADPSADPSATDPDGGGPTATDPDGARPSATDPDGTGLVGSDPGAPGATSGVPTGVASATPTGSTGIPPRIPLEWVAEVWVDPDWYAGQEAEEPMPSPGLPAVVPLTTRSILVGRVSASRNIHPDIDCADDTGVSRRHAQLSTDGSRWFVEDLASSNGTFVGPASGPLPDEPIAVGPRTELDSDDRVYVGAWTRIVVRRATDEEQEAGSA